MGMLSCRPGVNGSSGRGPWAELGQFKECILLRQVLLSTSLLSGNDT